MHNTFDKGYAETQKSESLMVLQERKTQQTSWIKKFCPLAWNMNLGRHESMS